MKIRKGDLKAIVKECLVELLAEGLGGPALVEAAAPRKRDRGSEPLPPYAQRQHVVPDPASTRRRTMDLVETRQTPPPVNVPTKDPMLAAIFADTARTTLVEQETQRAPVAGDQAARIAAQSDPADLFGEERLDAWNRAAFAPSRPGLQAEAAMAFGPQNPLDTRR